MNSPREPDAIREAVGAAEDAWRRSPSGTGVPAAIVAFLRGAANVHAGCYSGMDPRGTLKHLAAAVERAAKEAGDG